MTKQFVFFFILVVVAIVAVAIVTQIAIWESTHTWDLTALIENLYDVVDLVVVKLTEQDVAMQEWVDEATQEVADIETEILFWNDYVAATINPCP